LGVKNTGVEKSRHLRKKKLVVYSVGVVEEDPRRRDHRGGSRRLSWHCGKRLKEKGEVIHWRGEAQRMGSLICLSYCGISSRKERDRQRKRDNLNAWPCCINHTVRERQKINEEGGENSKLLGKYITKRKDAQISLKEGKKGLKNSAKKAQISPSTR